MLPLNYRVPPSTRARLEVVRQFNYWADQGESLGHPHLWVDVTENIADSHGPEPTDDVEATAWWTAATEQLRSLVTDLR